MDDQSYFKIKLAYNGTHHYIPVVPRSSQDFLDYDHEARYYIKQSRDALNKLSAALPPESWYKKLVDIAYRASLCTCDILLGVNNLTGATRAVGAAEPALFQYPGYHEGSAAPKRKRASATATTATATTASDDPQQPQVPGSSTQSDNPSGLPETAKEDFAPIDVDHSPKITVTHSQLRKKEKQCFCGKCVPLWRSLQHTRVCNILARGLVPTLKPTSPGISGGVWPATWHVLTTRHAGSITGLHTSKSSSICALYQIAQKAMIRKTQ